MACTHTLLMGSRPPKEARQGFFSALLLREDGVEEWDRFPFNIPAVRDLNKVKLHPAVTFLIGENGSGKSTIVEAAAVRLGHREIGGSNVLSFNQRPLDGGLHDAILMPRLRRPAETYFMRAETVFDFTNRIQGEIDTLEGFGENFGSLGGKSLHLRSHGEAFMAIVQNRFRRESFVMLDEPEAALSPQRQILLLKELDLLVREGCQFLIATHSPILMAYPDATIYLLDETGITEVAYDETEHYRLTRSFLESPKAFLHHLLDDESGT